MPPQGKRKGFGIPVYRQWICVLRDLAVGERQASSRLKSFVHATMLRAVCSLNCRDHFASFSLFSCPVLSFYLRTYILSPAD